MNSKTLFSRWRANFLTGLAVVFPGALSLIIVIWIFRNIASITDTLLIFLPRSWTHKDGGQGELYWYASWLAFIMAVALITLAGRMTRIYFGQKLIEGADRLMLRVPMLNKIYGTIKQVNEAFSSGKRTAFKQVVLVEYPRLGLWSLGFVTNEQPEISAAGAPDKLVSVFIPTTPNPTSGFIVLVPEKSCVKLDLPVADGIKFIISLGSLSPEQHQAELGRLKT